MEPLDLPGPQAVEADERLNEYEAVHLFLDRAQGAQPAFAPGEADRRAIAQICVTLGGLPLAIELAASHVKLLPPIKLANHLKDDLNALAPGPRDLPERQRTLRATIEWSYELLRPAEKKLFVRMPIFMGGGTLEGIREVCSQDLPEDPMGALSGLVEKSLVIPREGPDGELRFVMLELIRAFGQERLVSSGEMADIRLRHAQFYTRMVGEASQQMRTHHQNRWFKRLGAEQDNIRAVLSWSLRDGQPEFGMQVVSGMMDYWYYNGAAAEGHRWINLALQKMEGVEPAMRAGVLESAGRIAHGLGDPAKGREYSQGAVRLFQEAGDDHGMARELGDLGVTFISDGEQISQGIRHAQESLALFRESGDQRGMASTLNILGELYRVQGDDESAEQSYEESLELVKETGERQREAMLLNNLCFIACHRGEYDRALDLIQHSLKILQQLDNDYTFACGVGVAAGPAAGLGEWERAARLLGASEGLYEQLGSKNQFADQVEFDRTFSEVRAELGSQDSEIYRREGHGATRLEILAIIFDELGYQSQS